LVIAGYAQRYAACIGSQALADNKSHTSTGPAIAPADTQEKIGFQLLIEAGGGAFTQLVLLNSQYVNVV
jgi:hypothetical protein